MPGMYKQECACQLLTITSVDPIFDSQGKHIWSHRLTSFLSKSLASITARFTEGSHYLNSPTWRLSEGSHYLNFFVSLSPADQKQPCLHGWKAGLIKPSRIVVVQDKDAGRPRVAIGWESLLLCLCAWMQQILLRHIHDTPNYSHTPVQNPMLGLPSRPCQRVLPTPPCLQPPLPFIEHASDLVALSSCSILFSSSCCCLLLVFSGVGCSFLVAAERVDHARLSLQGHQAWHHEFTTRVNQRCACGVRRSLHQKKNVHSLAGFSTQMSPSRGRILCALSCGCRVS